MTFKLVIEAGFMPLISLLGVLGNVISIFVLHHKDVKLRKDFVDVLCAMAAFDILFLVCTFFLGRTRRSMRNENEKARGEKKNKSYGVWF